MTISQEIQRNREIRAQRQADLTLAAIGQGPLAGRRAGVRLAAAPAPREPTDPDYLQVKDAAMKLLAELGVEVDQLPDAVKEDLDWALRNFSWTPTNPQASSPAALGRYAMDAIFDSLVRVKAEEAKHGDAAIDLSDHSATGAALRSTKLRAFDERLTSVESWLTKREVERELQLNRTRQEIAEREAIKTLRAAHML